MNSQNITLTPEEHSELSRRVRAATISQRDGRRARVILLAAQGESRADIARLIGFSLPSVTRWCQRFQELRLDGLIDKPGRGRPSSLPAEALSRVLEQVVQPRIGQPRWSCRSMANVAGISPASVQRIWAANDIKPHLTRTFKLSNDPQFEAKFGDVIGLYINPPDKALVLCCDEKVRYRLWSAPSRDCHWGSAISARNRTIMSAMAPSLCSLRWTISRDA